MKRTGRSVLILVMALAIATGCGKKTEDTSGGSTGSAGTSGGASVMPATSPYDNGPRAGESPADEALARQGETLFKDKGCSACHGFGKRISCPDLNGVTMRRTQQWMEHQILHPEVMTKQDPIAHQLFAQYSLQMPNQGLTEAQAKAVIEFLKHKNHETAGAGK
ncbi:MAG: cytochrome c [Candidatus Eisenbacteria bacterium]|uniref:Cytochrome c n=1 Tax=Eiseniibacteriota bacterium TaxID=2212470 RepID=A0A9D6L8Q0_UNCEI|nr:cytochrome c [Candidatus Eisenbacteria bacterium]